MQKIESRIVEILKANEEALSDGYEFYCGGPECVDETLERIAAQIASLLTQRALDASPQGASKSQNNQGSRK